MIRSVVVWLFAAAVLASCSHSYEKEMQKALKGVYAGHSELKSYVFRSSPVGTFGAGSMYLKEMENGKVASPDASWFIGYPGNWWADNVTEEQKTKALKSIVVAGSLPPRDLSNQISKSLGIDATVPALYDYVNLGVKTDWKHGVKVKLSAKKAANHRVDWDAFAKANKDHLLRDKIDDHIQKRDFIIGAADVEVTGYTAEIELDDSVDVGIKAKLDSVAAAGMLSGTDLKVSASASQKGVYTVQASDPVIVAVLYKEPPAAISLAASDIMSWPTARIDNRLFAPLEKLIH